MGCALFFACYVLTVGWHSHEQDAMLTVVVSMSVCAFGRLFAGLSDTRAIWAPSDSAFWEGVLFAALFATAFMYAIQSEAQKYLEEEKVALTYLCEPIFAAIAGVVLLGEILSFRTIFGAGLILLALLIAELN